MSFRYIKKQANREQMVQFIVVFQANNKRMTENCIIDAIGQHVQKCVLRV